MNRVTETLGDLYGMHWPYKQNTTSRNEKLLPYHEELKKAGACFGVVGRFERPMWYSLNGEKREYEYRFNYKNWYPSAKYETINARKNVGLFDFSTFSKFDLKGEKVHNDLQKICTANIKNEIGKTSYSHMLNEEGGIEADLTVVCIDKNYFRIVSSAATRERDKHHILKYLSKEVEFLDITESICCLGLFGPKSRDMIEKISNDDYKSENFKFGTAKIVNIKNIKVWAQRISYVGELGFELYIDKENALKLYKILIKEGKNFIPMPSSVVSVIQIFPFDDQATNNMFDIRYQLRLNDLYDFSSTSIIQYQMTMQQLDFLSHILVGEKPLRFNQHQNRLYIDMDFSNDIDVGEFLIIECYRKIDPATYTDIFDDIYLKRYATALIKRQWGANLSKFKGVQILGGVEMDGEGIYSQAQEEINKLEEEIQLAFETPIDYMVG